MAASPAPAETHRQHQLYLWPMCWDAWYAAMQLRKPSQDFVDYDVPEPSPAAQLEWWNARVEPGHDLVAGLFARSDDRLVGTLKAFGFAPDRSSCEIGIEILDPADYGKGYGRIGLGLWLAYLQAQGVKEVFGLVHPDNDRSLALFDRLGFAQIGIVIDPQNPRMTFVEVALELDLDTGPAPEHHDHEHQHDHGHSQADGHAHAQVYHPRGGHDPHERELPTFI